MTLVSVTAAYAMNHNFSQSPKERVLVDEWVRIDRQEIQLSLFSVTLIPRCKVQGGKVVLFMTPLQRTITVFSYTYHWMAKLRWTKAHTVDGKNMLVWTRCVARKGGKALHPILLSFVRWGTYLGLARDKVTTSIKLCCSHDAMYSIHVGCSMWDHRWWWWCSTCCSLPWTEPCFKSYAFTPYSTLH